MMRLWAIARNAFVETIRQPIYGVLILVTFAVLVMDLPLSNWTMGGDAAEYERTDQQLLVGLGLSTLLVSGLLVAAFSAAGVVSREIEDHTILTVISKPVSRALLVGGKFLGLAGALGVSFYLCSLAFLMTVRHGVMPRASDPLDLPVIVLGLSAAGASLLAALFCNYFFGWAFASAAVGVGAALMTAAMFVIAFVGKGWQVGPFGQGISRDLLLAMLLMLLAVLVFAAVAVAASTRLGQVMTLLVCFAFFLVGSISPYLFERFAEQNPLARVASWVWPNLGYLYAIDALTQDRPIPLGYVGLAAGYVGFFIIAILAIGMALFQTRELEAQDSSSSAPGGVSLLAWTGRAAAAALAIVAVALPAGARTPRSFALGGALAAAAVLNWLLWGWFGRGIKWTWFLVLVAAGASGGLAAADLILPASLTGMSGTALAFSAAAAVLIVLVLLLPRSRGHFGVVRRRQGSPGVANARATGDGRP